MSSSSEMIYSVVTDCLSDVLTIKKDVVRIDSNLKSDLGMDSLAEIELLYSLEDKFKLQITDNEIRNKFFKVQDIVDFIHAKLN